MTTKNGLLRSTPEEQGISSAAILAFVEDIEQQIDALHSFMLLRHGHVVAEGWWSPYTREESHMLFSLSKSFTATAIGLAVAEGRLSVTDPVLSFFPEEASAQVGEKLAAMQVHHLLAMATGHVEDTTRFLRDAPDGNWAKAFLAYPVERDPGTHFLYNSGATYMLSAIIQKLTGMTLLDYLQPRLFAPLCIQNSTWESCPRGINVGGWGLKITTEAIACFGQLYLQKGEWQGHQLVPAAWVEAGTAKQVSNGSKPESDWEQGYGYQFWRCRHGAYRGDGAFGQYCIVMPEQDAVLAMTSGVPDMQAVLNVVWASLLPALMNDPLPADSAKQIALMQKLADLTLSPEQGAATSPEADRVNGKRYTFVLDQQANHTDQREVEAISLTFDETGTLYTLHDAQGEQQIRCGHGTWCKGTMKIAGRGVQSVAASGAWIATDTYVVKLYFYQTPFCSTNTFHFVDDQVHYHSRLNVNMGPTEYPQLIGQMS